MAPNCKGRVDGTRTSEQPPGEGARMLRDGSVTSGRPEESHCVLALPCFCAHAPGSGLLSATYMGIPGRLRI